MSQVTSSDESLVFTYCTWSQWEDTIYRPVYEPGSPIGMARSSICSVYLRAHQPR